jgi:hypothetical protein
MLPYLYACLPLLSYGANSLSVRGCRTRTDESGHIYQGELKSPRFSKRSIVTPIRASQA